MERFNVPIPPDEDFPQVICAQRYGEGLEKEFVEYVPRWNVDKYGQAVIVDKRAFFALADTADRLERTNAELRELVQYMHRYFHLAKVDGLCQWGPRIMRRIRDLGIEVDE